MHNKGQSLLTHLHGCCVCVGVCIDLRGKGLAQFFKYVYRTLIGFSLFHPLLLLPYKVTDLELSVTATHVLYLHFAKCALCHSNKSCQELFI